MVACLEKSDDNRDFHQIVDFLSSCSITYALTISPTIYASYIKQFWNTASSKTINSVKQIHAIVYGKAVVISESSVRSDLLFEDEDDKAVHGEEGDRFERGITTDVCLEAAHASDNIFKTHTTVMPNVDIPQGMDTGGRPRRQDTMGGTSAQTRSERVLEQPSEPPIPKGPTFGSREGRLKLEELMGRMIEELDKDKDVNLVSEQGEVQETVETSKDDDDATLAETLLNIKRSLAKDKGKGIMQMTKLPKKIKKKEMIQLSLDEEPFSEAEVRKNMIMYLKNQRGYKQSHFKGMKAGHATYTDRFHELARLVPHLVTPESRRIEWYVYGLALQIRKMVAATKPKTMQKAV
nr:reverse transcriptase domain-containing protein [Tanacetum cinerariifolium]